jgi:hypothetical protein
MKFINSLSMAFVAGKRRAVTKSLAIFLSTLALIMIQTTAPAQEGWGQITLNNKSSSTADMYVDGAYGCRALSGLFCVAQVRVGVHNLEAKTTQGRSVVANGVRVAQGEVRTFTILDKDE